MIDPAGWQPIETAPRDGTVILAFPCYGGGFGEKETEIAMVTWDHPGKWVNTIPDGYEAIIEDPSHWMPLPRPPA